MKANHAVALGLLASLAAFGQDQPAHPQFEVVSVRHSPEARPEAVAIGLHMDGSQARIAYYSLRDYIAMAYAVRPSQINGPEWLVSERYDLNAKLPAGATASQIPAMLQTVLTDRFQLKMHREKKEMPVYALILGKGPLKLKETAPDANIGLSKGSLDVAAGGSAAGVSVNLGNGSYYNFGNNKFEAGKMSMDVLARLLTPYVDRPIVNLTELKGSYDFTLNLAEEDYRAMLVRVAVNNGVVLPAQVLRFMEDNSPASLFDALQQLGLKLEPRKEPMDLLVIDSVLKTPTEN